MEPIFTAEALEHGAIGDSIRLAAPTIDTVEILIVCVVQVVLLTITTEATRERRSRSATITAEVAFIEELVKLKVNRKMKLEYPSAELSETEGEEIAFPSGYPLGEAPHSIVIFDDSPKELSTLTKASETLTNQTKATIVSVRSRRSGTREEQTEWEIESPYGEVDFSSKNVSSRELLKVFEINTYLAMKKNLGQDNPKVIEARQRLMSLGVTEPELAEIWMR